MNYFESEQDEKPSNASSAIVLDEINPANSYFYNEDQYYSSVSNWMGVCIWCAVRYIVFYRVLLLCMLLYELLLLFLYVYTALS